MLFNSYKFIFLFFPLVLWVSAKLKGRFSLIFIVLASFYFYSFAGHKWFLIPMLITTVLDFFLAPKIYYAKDQKGKKRLLLLSLTANLGLLFYFKYSFFILDSVNNISLFLGQNKFEGDWTNFFKVILPAGISFYTFQTISYIVDVYRGEAHVEKDFWLFSGFVSFFPHLVAGPLTRHNQLIPQLKNLSENGVKIRWDDGVFLFVIGLAKKILIADQISFIIDPKLQQMASLSILDSWLVLFGYTFQIYFDFSGYSDMAIGLSRLFGIELPQNFNSPYKATNVSDFWRRWHISLSLWLRDYLYISLGGNRKRKNFNLFMTMLLGGLWHGANWTFVIWGAYHGLLLIIHHQISKPWDQLPVWLQRTLTFLLVSFGWLFFRAESLTDALLWINKLFHWTKIETVFDIKLLFLVLVSLFVVNLFKPASHEESLSKKSDLFKVFLGFLFVVSLIFMNLTSKFLYFQF